MLRQTSPGLPLRALRSCAVPVSHPSHGRVLPDSIPAPYAFQLLQAVIAGKEARDSLRDVAAMLRNNSSNPQIEMITRVMKKWAKENGMNLDR